MANSPELAEKVVVHPTSNKETKETEICGIKHQSLAFLLAPSAGRAWDGGEVSNWAEKRGNAVWEHKEGSGARRQMKRGN